MFPSMPDIFPPIGCLKKKGGEEETPRFSSLLPICCIHHPTHAKRLRTYDSLVSLTIALPIPHFSSAIHYQNICSNYRNTHTRLIPSSSALPLTPLSIVCLPLYYMLPSSNHAHRCQDPTEGKNKRRKKKTSK